MDISPKFYIGFIYLFIFISLYNTVLVLPCIDMNPPWVAFHLEGYLLVPVVEEIFTAR